jgi:hypothetical protein
MAIGQHLACDLHFLIPAERTIEQFLPTKHPGLLMPEKHFLLDKSAQLQPTYPVGETHRGGGGTEYVDDIVAYIIVIFSCIHQIVR